jgi:hypothetical protein
MKGEHASLPLSKINLKLTVVQAKKVQEAIKPENREARS